MITKLLAKLTSLHPLYLGTILFFITFFCYANTLNNGLFFDDEQFIYKNHAVTTFDVGEFFDRSLTSGAGKLSNYYRPLLFFGFGIEYQLFHESGFIYHFDSLLIHFGGGLLLYLLLKKISQNTFVSLFTALLFLIHPLQTEAVAYASGRGDPLSFFFVMLTIILTFTKKKWMVALSVVTLICALLSKEIALITPGLIFLTHMYEKKNLSWPALKSSLLTSLPAIIVVLIYFLLRLTILNFANTLNFYNSENIYSTNLLVRLLTFFHLFPSYVSLLIFPKDLFMERDSLVQIITKPTIQAIVSICALLLICALSIWKRKQAMWLLFSLLWIGITFIPTSGILPINGIFYEHFLYYPSVGFFFIFVWSLWSFSKKLPRIGKEIIGLILLCSIILLSWRTILRNNDWQDAITFYSQTLNYVQSPRAENNLAMAYAEKGDPTKAIQHYQKAIALQDVYPESHYNLANAYLLMKKREDALREYHKATSLDPSFYLAYIKLYALYSEDGNSQAKKEIEQTLTTLGQKFPSFITLRDQLKLRYP